MRRILLPIIIFLAAFIGLSIGIHSLTQGNTLGTDFYIFYRAGQTAFIDRSSPYSDQLSLENQLAIFKQPARPDQDHLNFAYPPYVLLAVLPFIGLDFAWAQALWAALLILAMVGAIALAFPGAPPWVTILFLCFYPVTFGLILGNFAVLIGAALLLIFGVISRPANLGRFAQACLGLLLAWLTAKPQFMWLFAILFLLMAFKRRWWTFLAASAAGTVFFLAVSFAIVPGWPALWLESASKYTVFNHSGLILSVLLGDILPQGAALPVTIGLAALLLAITAWLFWRWWLGWLDIGLLLAWCGVVVYALHPRGVSYEHITFLLPLVVWACRQAKQQPFPVLAFWFGSLLVSWAAFFISVQPGAPASATEWPLLFGAIWVGWLYLRRPLPQ